MTTLLIITHLALSGINAKCVDGMRSDPLLMVQGPNKTHYIYYLPNQKKECQQAARDLNNRKHIAICGCKILKSSPVRDRLRLRCLRIKNNQIYSRTVGIYYYASDEIIDRCKWMTKEIVKQLEK